MLGTAIPTAQVLPDNVVWLNGFGWFSDQARLDKKKDIAMLLESFSTHEIQQAYQVLAKDIVTCRLLCGNRLHPDKRLPEPADALYFVPKMKNPNAIETLYYLQQSCGTK